MTARDARPERQDDEECDTCYKTRSRGIGSKNTGTKARLERREQVALEILTEGARCICGPDLTCRDQTCLYFYKDVKQAV